MSIESEFQLLLPFLPLYFAENLNQKSHTDRFLQKEKNLWKRLAQKLIFVHI